MRAGACAQELCSARAPGRTQTRQRWPALKVSHMWGVQARRTRALCACRAACAAAGGPAGPHLYAVGNMCAPDVRSVYALARVLGRGRCGRSTVPPSTSAQSHLYFARAGCVHRVHPGPRARARAVWHHAPCGAQGERPGVRVQVHRQAQAAVRARPAAPPAVPAMRSAASRRPVVGARSGAVPAALPRARLYFEEA